MVLSLAQRLYRSIKMRRIFNFISGVPLFNALLLPKFNRYEMARIMIIFAFVVPFIGFFRRAYIKNKFNEHLESKNQTTQLQLKQSLQKFQIKMPKEVEYMVIVQLEQIKQDEQISDIDKENSSKIFTLLEEAHNFPEVHSIKWAFLGSKKLFEVIQAGRNSQRNQNFSIEFHQHQNMKKQSKVFLLARDDDEEKVIMDWPAGVPLKQISKYIARHKYKKYLREINF